MRSLRYSILLAVSLFGVMAFAAAPKGDVEVIPYPQSVNVSTQKVSAVTSVKTVRNSRMAPESYVLKVSSNGKAVITAADKAGEFYALQTLNQQLERGGAAVGTIKDAPRYSWRGFMLDESRHFSGEERVKWILDEMARLKMNKFHWHLSDAQGWRVEIKAYPRLAQVGGQGSHSDIDGPIQYYTQEQIRDIVAYAAERNIEIIPEIDMPGHASAANKAYPQYSGGGVSAGFPDFTFNVGKEETYEFLETILKEIADLFPSDYIMIGGDEVSYGSYAWLANKDIVGLMEKNGYTNVLEAEGYFIRRISEYVNSIGKKMIGWDDIVDFGVPTEGNMMMWWRHDNVKRLHDVLDGGYETVLCPRKPMYFDFVQHDDHKVGRKWDGFCPIEDVYSFPDAYYEHWGVTADDLSKVKGVQSNLWSELTHNTDRVDFMVFPRLMATAESAWTLPENKNYERFTELLEYEYGRLDKIGVYYYDYRDPAHHSEPAGPVLGERPVDRQIVLENDNLKLTLSTKGYAQSLVNKLTGEECLYAEAELPLCTITQERPYDNENFLMFPAKPITFPSNKISLEGDMLKVEFKDTYDILCIRVKKEPTYLSFTLENIDYRIEDYGVKRKTEIDQLALLQLPVRNMSHFGEWLNVSWDQDNAVCLLGLNPETRIDAFKMDGCRNMFAGADNKVALLGVSAALAVSDSPEGLLSSIDRIEKDCNLPRGVESRRCAQYPYSYYEVRNVTPENVDRHIEFAHKGGFHQMVIYYPDFAYTCGHYLWNKSYPNGMEDLKLVVGKMKAAGMEVGLHIHYNKVSVDDPYVASPRPDYRLNSVAQFTLARDIKPGDTSVWVEGDARGVRTEQGRKILRVGDEYFSYESVSCGKQSCFKGCNRGLYKTAKKAHKRGEIVLQPDLDDWPRFIRIDQNSSLQDEIAKNIASIYDSCGFSFLYFDGAEDVPSPYWYNVAKSQYAVWSAIQSPILFAEGAQKAHFGWHMLSRGNAFDHFPEEKIPEAMERYTLRCARQISNDFTSVDFGWLYCDMHPQTYEYICSKAAEYNCPISFIADLDKMDACPWVDESLAVIKSWEDKKN